MNLGSLAALAASLAIVGLANAVELTFELPDNAKECFFEVIEKGTEATLEFQVRTEIEMVFSCGLPLPVFGFLSLSRWILKNLVSGCDWRPLRR